MATRRGYQPGPTAQRVRANLNQLRDQRRISLRALSDELKRLGHPLLASGLSKIEVGTRRVDVDDLLGLAIGLDVAPNRLLFTGTADDETIGLTPEAEVSELTAWRWATGEGALPIQLWTDQPVAVGLKDRERRFREENRPHDPGQTPIRDLEKHEQVLTEAVQACGEAVEKSGLPREVVVSYVAWGLRMRELFGWKGEGDQSGEH